MKEARHHELLSKISTTVIEKIAFPVMSVLLPYIFKRFVKSDRIHDWLNGDLSCLEQVLLYGYFISILFFISLTKTFIWFFHAAENLSRNMTESGVFDLGPLVLIFIPFIALLFAGLFSICLNVSVYASIKGMNFLTLNKNRELNFVYLLVSGIILLISFKNISLGFREDGYGFDVMCGVGSRDVIDAFASLFFDLTVLFLLLFIVSLVIDYNLPRNRHCTKELIYRDGLSLFHKVKSLYLRFKSYREKRKKWWLYTDWH